jgi:hypothetical protein
MLNFVFEAIPLRKRVKHNVIDDLGIIVHLIIAIRRGAQMNFAAEVFGSELGLV